MSRNLRLASELELAAYYARRGVGNAESVDVKRIGMALEPRESEIQASVLEFLRRHPRVAFCWRANTGMARYDNSDGTPRFLRFGFRGCSDILGMLRGGVLLAVECKRKGERLTEDQQAFLQAVNGGGGLGFIARSIDDVMRALA